jgi:uncharacterized membrane protein YdjX (TVP38/TMEM64 family)
MAEPAPRPNRGLLIKLAVAGVVAVVGVVLVARGLDLKGLLTDGLAFIRGLGPVAFFLAMATLPAVGAPLSAFTLTAGPVFAPTLGLGVVIFFALSAITINMAASYWLARWAFRPLAEKIFRRLGYALPRAQAGDEVDLIVLLRVTPGVPFPVQNYLLGLAEMPFGKYLLVSCAIQWPINAAFIAFGDALLQGRGKVALIALSVIVALLAGTQLVRKHYGKKRA